jgi:hypothetical protein
VFDRHCPQVGDAAHARGLPLYELTPAGTSLEALFLQLTADPADPPGVGPLAAPGVAR